MSTWMRDRGQFLFLFVVFTTSTSAFRHLGLVATPLTPRTGDDSKTSCGISPRRTPELRAKPMPDLPSFVSRPPEEESSSYSSQDVARTSTSTMVLMDVENIRGATSFGLSHEALLSRIKMWREDRLSIHSNSYLEPLVWVCDHGIEPSIHHCPIEIEDQHGTNVLPHNFGAIFAGPGRTADDVIVDLVEGRVSGGNQPDVYTERNTTIVITADSRLISRCQQVRRRSESLSDLVFVEPTSLLQQLERYRVHSDVEERLFGERRAPPSGKMYSPTKMTAVPTEGKDKDGKTATMTSFKDSSIAAHQHAKFQARFQNNAIEVDSSPKQESQQPIRADDSKALDTKSDESALGAQLATEQIRRQMLLSDAYYLAQPKKLRNRKSQFAAAAIHAKYKNRNISKKQQKKLYAKRFGDRRQQALVSAATQRKILAERLQTNLHRESGSSESVMCLEEGGTLLLRAMQLRDKLLHQFATDEHKISFNGSSIGPSIKSDNESLPGSEASSGAVLDDGTWDPIGATLNIPLRDEQQVESSKVPNLRVVVISDTHGFEGALCQFAEKQHRDVFDGAGLSKKSISNEFMLPKADVLLHCGDFSASGSRKSQRVAGRRLDEFLARQAHIPEKIVVQGNHDPDSTAKVLFPRSKALYVRHSSTLKVNGVTFAIEPYSRRMSHRRYDVGRLDRLELPKCDVFVSHEPPKNVLDLTYHGFRVGSAYLRGMVEHSENKPRLWCCGHIHESRGVVIRHFANDDSEEDGDETVVLNASNSNTGRANRLVAGAVVVEIERTSIGDETASKTFEQVRRDFADEGKADGVHALSRAGLEGTDTDYITRPGVRRRKGVRQLKVSR